MIRKKRARVYHMKNANILNIFLYFIFYSFLGWMIETVYMSIYWGHLVKRGFLVGPVCGIYGVGTLLVVYLLSSVRFRPFSLFIYSCLLTTLVELVTGFLLLWIFDLRLWNYGNDFLNINGFVSLKNALIWGSLSMIMVYVIHPAVVKYIEMLPLKTKELICCSLSIFLMSDLIFSVYSNLHGINNFQWISHAFLKSYENFKVTFKAP